MLGTNVDTGAALEGIDHMMQSIRDILTTPIGSRVMRRDYGSRLFELLDHPTEPGIEVEIYAGVAEALDRWEPRFELKRVSVVSADAGHITLDIVGIYKPNGQEVTLPGVVV